MPLHRAIRKYGKENFTIELLDIANNSKELAVLEAKYIRDLKSNENDIGYNLCDIVDLKIVSTKEWRLEASKRMTVINSSEERKLINRLAGENNRGKLKNLPNKTSKYIGVCFAKKIHKDKIYTAWVAKICLNSKRIQIGRYLFEEDAAKAYDIEALKLFGKTASLNFPDLREAYLNGQIKVEKKIHPRTKILC